jgi:TetR/AcrR family transcriptional regulator of autoinduction and epiphytic fitness
MSMGRVALDTEMQNTVAESALEMFLAHYQL